MLCFSGGLDSLIAWYIAEKPACLYVKLGHRYEMKELSAVKRLTARNSMSMMIDASVPCYGRVWEKDDDEIPNRNFLLAMLAVNHGADVVLMAFNRGEVNNPSNDRSPEFMAQASMVLSHMAGRKITVSSPVLNMTKTMAVSWFISRFDPKILLDTVSCFSPTSIGTVKHCGECSSCFRKFIALDYNTILTDHYFRAKPYNWEGVPGYLQGIRTGKYDVERRIEMLSVLSKYQGGKYFRMVQSVRKEVGTV